MAQRQTNFFDTGVTFGASFLSDHAGQLMTDGRLAITELVANAYDAGARSVRIHWPSVRGEEFWIEDNGSGMTPEQFARRWKTLGYNRLDEQGRFAEVPAARKSTRERVAFGQSGKGRHGAFCFTSEYHIETWRDGTCIAVDVRLTSGGSEPFEFGEPKTSKKRGSGTRISAIVERNLIDTEGVATAIGSKFLVDPEFSITLNGKVLDLLSLDVANPTLLQVEGVGEIEITEIDPQASDRTTHLRGITWWVHGRMVGNPSWDGLDDAGAVLDGRTSVAKRLSYVIKADVLKPEVRADWTGFRTSVATTAVRTVARQFITARLNALLADDRSSRKRSALTETANTLRSLPPVSRDSVAEFTEHVLAVCPTIKQGDLARTVEVFAKMEKARSGYELLGELAACSPEDIDHWTEIMRRWTATDAKHVLGELHWRLDLIARLDELIRAGAADELHDLQPLFERGLWIFGPAYESVEFCSNRTLATVVRELLGQQPVNVSAKRPDFVALPDRSIGVYAADNYDQAGEVLGISRVLVVELKRGGSTLTSEELWQPKRYVDELRSKNHVQSTTSFDVFVLGSTLADDGADKVTFGSHTTIWPMTYERVLKRANARTFNLLEKLKTTFPDMKTDADVSAAIEASKSLFDAAK